MKLNFYENLSFYDVCIDKKENGYKEEFREGGRFDWKIRLEFSIVFFIFYRVLICKRVRAMGITQILLNHCIVHYKATKQKKKKKRIRQD